MDEGIHDLLILTDATASMGTYLGALNDSLPEIIRISALTGCFSRIGVLAYRDYNRGKVTEWSGWYAAASDSADAGATTSRDQLLDFVKLIRSEHGGDWPEATKTGLAAAYEHMRPGAKTIMLIYSDAPPHTPATGGDNRDIERSLLRQKDSFGGYGPLFVDWVSATNALRDGEKKAQVFSIIGSQLADTLGPFTFLSTRTEGVCFELDRNPRADVISKTTVDILLTWMGAEKEGSKANTRDIASVVRYIDQSTIGRVKSEDDDLSKTYWVKEDEEPIVRLVKQNLRRTEVSADELKHMVVGRRPPVTDFSKRYLADEAYRGLVVDNLMDIIQSDVTAVAVNPVFGSLWRTVCNDRLNEARDGLIEAFGTHVDRISDAAKRADMKVWLEESYDYAAEIVEIIRSVPEDERYPCVFLDPTLEFEPTTAEAGEDSGPAKFTREELLEIGRSCDYRILRRLGRVLTRLTYVATKDELPAHIKDEPDKEVPRIPLALVAPEYKRKFWKVLLHAVLPGTMLSPRPAALLAALSLRMGMLPLRDAADTELLQWNNKWNTLDIPETWNTNCLALILDADDSYEARVKEGITARPSPEAGLLTLEDRRLFKTLVDYKMLEMNLETTLTAKVGWRPEKTKVSMGPTTICRVCHYPRSVTMMGTGGVCGFCDEGVCSCPSPEEHEERVHGNVSKTDDEATKISWVECTVTSCRAQYAVYHQDKLQVRPKCHFCRNSKRSATDTTTPSAAPFVECTKCLSRMIWPTEYRPSDFQPNKFTCPACTSGDIQTIIDVPTTTKSLAEENGRSWLLRNDGPKIAAPFTGRSLFHVISTAGRDGFADAVEVLPAANNTDAEPAHLTIRGKLVRNQTSLLTELAGWISARRAQAGTCSLCFSAVSARNRGDLTLACGRSGCLQRICGACRGGWYGLNGRGRVINAAALLCPFCRRRPAAGKGGAVGGVGDLRLAVEEAGSWVYAWCAGCGFARRFVERVCAAGAPAEVVGWRCDGCMETGVGVGLRIKNCPGCGVPTEKMGGCDHIECLVDGCRTHWCFYCGLEVSPEEIYQHMADSHGGWYDGQQDEAYESDNE
ncbi:hypothetical protein QBC33DRAFT_544957 [Phialemonium atrogriseum]|uniref:RBR-type E3 ubiquitin transferase n=1 Tax=Phialemonium atrogriseum TaxID=1093897 RepID=A0AAJ0BY60_9PEZI|nr:uncharacterized protein QBC33DRAFT_544957 [Phialemonium atrogriseum]KAK1765232.1 hypothetical protein QBC33DRAFT_544957 [Phialemonium atrogriseum]